MIISCNMIVDRRDHTLEGESGGTPLMEVKGGEIPVENSFRSSHSFKMSSQDMQLILIFAFFLPKIKLQ